MQKKKLTLDDLSVESFVTSLDAQEQQQGEGGTSPVCLSVLGYTLSVAATAYVTYTIYTATPNTTVDPNATPCPANTNTRVAGVTGCGQPVAAMPIANDTAYIA